MYETHGIIKFIATPTNGEFGILSNKDNNDVPELLNRKLCGRIDCIDSDDIYEFKCTNKLEKEHYLQLAIYMYMHKMNKYREEESNFVGEEKKKIAVNDKVSYTLDDTNNIGHITKIYKNGNINIKNIKSKKTDKIERNKITNNISYDESNDIKRYDDKSRYYLYNILSMK